MASVFDDPPQFEKSDSVLSFTIYRLPLTVFGRTPLAS